MGVIIHEFEIVPDLTPPAGAGGQEAAPPAPPPTPTPEEVERIHRHFVERRRRVAAD